MNDGPRPRLRPATGRLTSPAAGRLGYEVAERHGGRREPGRRWAMPLVLLRRPRAGVTSVAHHHYEADVHRHEHLHLSPVHLSAGTVVTGGSHRVIVERVVARSRRVEAPDAPRSSPAEAGAPREHVVRGRGAVAGVAPPALEGRPPVVSTVVSRGGAPSVAGPRADSHPAPHVEATASGASSSPLPMPTAMPLPTPTAMPLPTLTPLPAHEVDRLADRVIDVIERRVGAYRERTGRG